MYRNLTLLLSNTWLWVKASSVCRPSSTQWWWEDLPQTFLKHTTHLPSPNSYFNQHCSGKSSTDCLVSCMYNLIVYWIILTCMSPDFWPGAFPLDNLEHSEQPSGHSCILNSYVRGINAPWSHLWSTVDRIQLTNVSSFNSLGRKLCNVLHKVFLMT